MLASIIYNHGKFCDDFKSTLKLGAYVVQDLLSDLPYLNPGEECNEYAGPPNAYLESTGIRCTQDVLTEHQTRNIREVDRDIYRIAIGMWNDNHRRLHYTDLPNDLQFHNNNTGPMSRFSTS